MQRSVVFAEHWSCTGSTFCACMTVHELVQLTRMETQSMCDVGQKLGQRQTRICSVFRHRSSACPTLVFTGIDIVKMRCTKTVPCTYLCACTKTNGVKKILHDVKNKLRPLLLSRGNRYQWTNTFTLSPFQIKRGIALCRVILGTLPGL